MKRRGRKSLDPGLRPGRVAAAVDYGITYAFVDGVSHHRIGVHGTAQLKNPEDHREDDHDHQRGFQQALARFRFAPNGRFAPHVSTETSWRPGDGNSAWLAE